MADELLWENLIAAVADGTSNSNSAAEFRNDSSRTMHIRTIFAALQFVTAALNEDGVAELSKSPVLGITTNNGVFFTFPIFIGRGVTGDGSEDRHIGRNFGVGQLTLEPNESLFINMSKTSGGDLTAAFEIGFHF